MKRNYLYALFGLVIVAAYAITDLRGIELRQTTRSMAPKANVWTARAIRARNLRQALRRRVLLQNQMGTRR